MANTTSSIKDSWPLLTFAKAHGKKMQVGEFSNSETGETFKSCIFGEGNTRVFVSFSSKLGELTPRQIVAQQHSLQVVQLESGSYKLCKQGDNAWEDVALDL